MSARNARISAPTESAQWDLVLTRVFDALRELVFKAWTDTKHMQQWWGPNGFTNPVCELDPRAGGAIRIDMRAPDGVVYPMKGVFEEIEAPERLVFISSALDEKGNSMFDILNTVTFADQRGKTALTLQARVIRATAQAPQYLKGMEGGWTQSLDRLNTHLVSMKGDRKGMHLATSKPSDLSQTLARLEEKLAMSGGESAQGDDKDDFVFTRVFNAPRDLVFKAWTEPQRLAQWWGPKGWVIDVKQIDLRPGGVFHYVMNRPHAEMWGKFVYREIMPPDRLVFVNSFSNEKGETVRGPFNPNFPLEILNTVVFTEDHGKTTLTLRGHPIDTTEVERKTYAGFRDSMRQGFGGTFDQLEAYLAQG